VFDGIKGTKWGNQVADVVAQSTTEIVNYAIEQDSCEISAEDTLAVLREVFSGCWTVALLAGVSKSATQFKIGTALKQATTVLGDWYISVSGATLDTETRVDLKMRIPGDLERYSAEWRSGLKNSHSELIGRGLQEWLPAISSNTIAAVETHLSNQLQKNLGTSFAPFVTSRLVDAFGRLLT
jgi:hypothetical protein